MLLVKSLNCHYYKQGTIILEIKRGKTYSICRCIFCGHMEKYRNLEYLNWIKVNTIIDDKNILSFIKKIC
jgi:hypothetical protein